MKRDWIYLIVAFFASTCIFLGYYYFTKFTQLDIVYKNWDGPSYVLAAMSLYDPSVAYQNNFIHSGDIHPDWTWLPAHFPLVPLLIRAFSFIGYFPAMLVVSLIFTLGVYLAFYELVSALKITRHPLALTFPLIFLPPRWFIASHTGGSETAFLFFVLLFLLFFHRREHGKAALFVSLAQLARPQGVFLGLGLLIIALADWFKSRDLRDLRPYLPYLALPLTILGVFGFYYLRTGNFFAFFESIKLTHNLQLIPFRTFNFPSPNIETFWQEVNAYDYVIYFTACLMMFRKHLWRFGVISLVYFVPLIFLQHSDISRYAIPLIPFAFIAFSQLIEKREFTLATFLMSPAVMLYAINFMDHNHGS